MTQVYEEEELVLTVLTDCHFGQPHDSPHYKHKKINKLQGVFGANLVTLLPAWSIEGLNAILLFKNIFLRNFFKVIHSILAIGY